MSDEKPDFEALRGRRNESMQKLIEATAKKLGGEGPVFSTFNPNSCYCACPEGPCEHDFQGWREFDDGCGGETVCKRCGMGAMSHSLRCDF
jgi:hypothetical protein